MYIGKVDGKKLYKTKKYLLWAFNEMLDIANGPTDGVGGTIKHRVFRDVKSGKVSIRNTEHFAVYAGSILNGITSFYMPVEEVLGEPENTNGSPRTPGTLEIHKIPRTFSMDSICKIEFCYTAVDEKPFHEQWYKDGTKRFVVTENFHYRTTLILHVLSAMELMQ